MAYRSSSKSDAAALGVIFLIILAVLVIIFYPFALIWALNTLFNLNIAFGFHTWLASLLLLVPLSARAKGSSS